MRSLLCSMVRVSFSTSIVLVALAIVLGRFAGGVAELRQPASPRFQPMSGLLFPGWCCELRLLDRETGRLERVRLPGGDRLGHSAFSPWRDGLGRAHLVGLWNEVNRPGVGSVAGLVRYAVPGWEVIDRYEMDILPAGPPCWFPDMSTRILFAGWDGQLYGFTFADPADGGTADGGDHPGGPRPLVWRVAKPARSLMISAPQWPRDPALQGKIIATLTREHPGAAGPLAPRENPTRSELWWLQLSADGTAIEGVGRLIVDSSADPGRQTVEEDLAAVATVPGIGLVLAYQAREQPTGPYRLRLAPVVVDDRGVPTVEAAEAVDVMTDGILSAACFSPDGRWLYAIPRLDVAGERARRLPVADLLARPPRWARPGLLAGSGVTGG